MLFSAHLSKALLALSLLSSPMALSKPIATTTSDPPAETTSLDVWEPPYHGPTALDKREDRAVAIANQWRFLVSYSVIPLGAWGLYNMGSDCKEFKEDTTVKKGAKCVVAVAESAIGLGSVVIEGYLKVRSVAFYYTMGEIGRPVERSNILSIEGPKPAAPSPA
ncbi:hypothetical protein CPLU01_11773 [Colletotrichum plurivorum]|uniref:Uncharacterized protein n=1 Tax=Colletotrichum plurivorum TaxID=2175906 RepID=A0A8H6K1Z0_9PEZI|nr:hypothetical protein CPLU01_11773 [Colletotrichum plurivorum]